MELCSLKEEEKKVPVPLNTPKELESIEFLNSFEHLYLQQQSWFKKLGEEVRDHTIKVLHRLWYTDRKDTDVALDVLSSVYVALVALTEISLEIMEAIIFEVLTVDGHKPKADEMEVFKERWQKYFIRVMKWISYAHSQPYHNVKLPIQRKAWYLGKELGHGTFSVVYNCHEKHLNSEETKHQYACKVFQSLDDIDCFMKEVALYDALEGVPGILKVFDVHPCAIVIQKCELTLEDVIQKKNYNMEHVILWMLQLCETMKVAHERRVFHHDLKPQNVMLASFKDPSIFVVDWGSGRTSPTVKDADFSRITTLWYRPPETWSEADLPLDWISVDLWAVGCIFYELVFRRPYISPPEYASFRQIKEEMTSARDRLVDSSSELKNHIRGFLRWNPSERWSWDDAITALTEAKDNLADCAS